MIVEKEEGDDRCNDHGEFQISLHGKQEQARAEGCERGERTVNPATNTYHEELGDPTKLENEGEVPFGEVFQHSLGLVGRHVLVRFEVIREAIALLDHVDALVAKATDNEHVRWEHQAKESDPELGIGNACQDSWKNSSRDEEDRNGSHQGHFLHQSHGCLHIDTRSDGLKRMS